MDLSANDMEVCIVRAYNLGNKEVNGKDVDAYVSWDIGWPTEGSPGAGSGKGDTTTAPRGMDPGLTLLILKYNSNLLFYCNIY